MTDPNYQFTRANFNADRNKRGDENYMVRRDRAIDEAIRNSVNRGELVSRDEVAIVPTRQRSRFRSMIGDTRNHGTPHSAVDLVPGGGPLYASVGGEVVFRGWWNHLSGETIIIRDDRGTRDQRDDRYWYYSHLVEGSADDVNVGDIVRRNDRIGTIGRSGNAPYDMLHLLVRTYGQERASTGTEMLAQARYNPPRTEPITDVAQLTGPVADGHAIQASSRIPLSALGDLSALRNLVQPTTYRFSDFNRPIVAPLNGRSDWRRDQYIDYVENPDSMPNVPAPVFSVATATPETNTIMPDGSTVQFPPNITGGINPADPLTQPDPGNSYSERGLLGHRPLPPF